MTRVGLRKLIWENAELSVSHELNGTDSHRTWTVTVRYKSFSGEARKYGDLAPYALDALLDIAMDKLVESIKSKHELTTELLSLQVAATGGE